MKIFVLSLAATLAVQAAPVQNVERTTSTCTSPLQRKAWHKLTREEKASYIAAEKCLMSTPTKLHLATARTMFDDFQMLHVLVTKHVHGVGAFLPFHRFYIHAHEHILRTSCNYTGAHPYWDETLDAGNFSTSILLDPETGFGGNGVGKDNCIATGPFKDYVNTIGPGEVNTEHCIDRQVNDCASKSAEQKVVDSCMKMTNFEDAWNCLEGGPHTAGHGGIGGQMFNVFSSPGDPLFYLHHAWLDKLWWDWQSKSLPLRLKEMGGSNDASSFFAFFGTNFTLPTNFTFPEPMPGDPGNVTTLGHVLTVQGIIPDATIGDVMDIQGGLLCYEYL
ncbi:hypothetical protein BCR34DRAFT_651193 [Clohesyomyces aquaticus]|uniref:Tyrosinase copper-binding domain-containing protein n=1 Tax=Clohesyomyces aquaticus TaxID=1231657 RepID=A0A1Y1ZQB7_9PLEO|nr:hypothetical protein BCR34DRAFT_651193 [Clohesyomyces aquaticus]